MEPPPGKKAESEIRPAGLLETAGRFVGFLMFAVPAMIIVAALILLPVYKHNAYTQWEYACLQTKVAEADDYKQANERFKSALKDDEVLNTRLIMSQSTLTPANEDVVRDPSNAPHTPVGVVPIRRQVPPPPGGPLIAAANRIENRNTWMGLIMTAVGALLAAMYLFSPPPSRRS